MYISDVRTAGRMSLYGTAYEFFAKHSCAGHPYLECLILLPHIELVPNRVAECPCCILSYTHLDTTYHSPFAGHARITITISLRYGVYVRGAMDAVWLCSLQKSCTIDTSAHAFRSVYTAK